MLVAAFVATAVAASAASSKTAAQLLAASLSAAKQQHSLHYQFTFDDGKVTTVTMTGEAALNQGVQVIHFQKGATSGYADVVMIGRAVYVRGDRFALQNYMHFSPQLAAKTAGRWVFVPTTSTGYKDISADVEFRSFVSDIGPEGKVTKLSPSTMSGIRVIGVRHTAKKGAETLYVQASGLPLPVAAAAQDGSGTYTATYGNWNEPVGIARPVPEFTLR